MRPPFSQLLIYALGQFGWSLASFGVANLLIYYYMPPEDGQEAMFKPMIYQGAVFGVFTIIGLLGAFGRVFDAVLDPLVGNWSDRSTSHFGKRRFFMGIAAVPFALLGFLVFFPAFYENTLHQTIYLTLTLGLFYFFFTLYFIPYTALIPELGHDEKDRMNISTMVSVTWALGFLVGNSIYAIQDGLEQSGLLPQDAFLFGQFVLSAVALVFMLLPVFFLKETKYAKQQPSSIPVRQAVRQVFDNRNFRFFLASDLLYWFALTFIQLGVGFFTTLLFGLEKSQATLFGAVGFLTSFLLYVPINFLTRKYGKKTLLKAAFAVFSLLFLLLGFTDTLPMPKQSLFYLLAVLSAFPLAVFGILPNALIGDEVEAAAEQTGEQLAGMYYGVRAFVMKAGISLANLIFPSLLLLGKSVEQPSGVRATAFVACAFCVLGMWFFGKYEVKR